MKNIEIQIDKKIGEEREEIEKIAIETIKKINLKVWKMVIEQTKDYEYRFESYTDNQNNLIIPKVHCYIDEHSDWEVIEGQVKEQNIKFHGNGNGLYIWNNTFKLTPLTPTVVIYHMLRYLGERKYHRRLHIYYKQKWYTVYLRTY